MPNEETRYTISSAVFEALAHMIPEDQHRRARAKIHHAVGRSMESVHRQMGGPVELARERWMADAAISALGALHREFMSPMSFSDGKPARRVSDEEMLEFAKHAEDIRIRTIKEMQDAHGLKFDRAVSAYKERDEMGREACEEWIENGRISGELLDRLHPQFRKSWGLKDGDDSKV